MLLRCLCLQTNLHYLVSRCQLLADTQMDSRNATMHIKN